MSEVTIEHLRQLEEIRQLRPQYCRLLDTKQWERLRDLFAPDAVFEGFTFVRANPSPSDFVADLAKKLEGSVTVHHCHSPEIRITGAREARASWPMMDIVEWPRPGALARYPSADAFCGYGFYEERYRLYEGSWRISLMRLTRTRIEPLVNGVRDIQYDPHDGLKGYVFPSPDWVISGKGG